MSKIKKILYTSTSLVGAVTIGLLAGNALLGQGASANEETSSENYTIQAFKKEYRALNQETPVTEEYIDSSFVDFPDDSRIIAEEGGGFSGVILDPASGTGKIRLGNDNQEVDAHDPRSASIDEVKAALKAEFVK